MSLGTAIVYSIVMISPPAGRTGKGLRQSYPVDQLVPRGLSKYTHGGVGVSADAWPALARLTTDGRSSPTTYPAFIPTVATPPPSLQDRRQRGD